MANKINISIPLPCHENWQEMTTMDKGRFCNSCQKKVFDFTSSSDREIINAFDKNNNLCGRFLNTQLNRDLIKPKEKSSLWLATTTALISLVGLNEVTAQQKESTEQTDDRALGKFIATPVKIKLVGKIIDDDLESKIAEVLIQIKGKDNVIYSDDKGCFEVTVYAGDILVFSKKDFNTREIPINSEKKNFTVSLENKSSISKERYVTAGGACIIRKVENRTFLGRTFHSIGNLFR